MPSSQEIVPDGITDKNEQGVGAWQLKRNISNIQELLTAGGGKRNVTGHSLGGAFAQWAASEMPGMIGRIVTFQAPGISFEATEKLAAHDKTHPHEAIGSTHYEAEGDPCQRSAKPSRLATSSKPTFAT